MLAAFDLEFDARKHPGPQAPIGVGYPGFHPEATALRVECGRHEIDDSGEVLIWIRGHLHRHPQTRLRERDRDFGQRELQLQAVDRVDLNQRNIRVDPISGRDVTRAKSAIKGRANARSLEVDPRKIHNSLCGRYPRARLGQLRSRRDPDLRELLGALEDIRSQYPIRFGFAQRRTLFIRAKDKEHVTSRDPLPFLEFDGFHDALNLGAQNHRLRSSELAHDLHAFGKEAQLDTSGFDHTRRRAIRRLQCIRVATRRHQRRQGEDGAKPVSEGGADHLSILSRVSGGRRGGREAPSGPESTTGILPLPNIPNGNPLNLETR